MKLFTLQTNLESYKYPLIKIMICITIILGSIYRDNFIITKVEIIDNFVTFIAVIATLASILCTYISIGELFHVYSNRKNHKELTTFKFFLFQEIKKQLLSNDIIEMVAFSDSIVKFGTSSDCKHSNWNFFDKRFYIDDKEYCSYEEFEYALSILFPNEVVPIIEIDGIRQSGDGSMIEP